jgi:MinD-like ATPase involved in chromosome partitioning or flagellar assembly
MTVLVGSESRPSSDVEGLVGAVTAPLTRHARVAVWGVKGGVGTTTVALLAGLALARHQPGPIVVADQSLYGSLAIRAGTVLPAEPFARPAAATEPAIVIGQPAPPGSITTLLDAPPAATVADRNVAVVSATVDAVLMAEGHTADLVVLTHLTPGAAIDTATARRRLGGEIVELPFDAHLATVGPIAWERLQPATRDAARHLAAALITTLPTSTTPHPDESE